MIKDSIGIEDIEIQKGGRASIKRYTKKKMATNGPLFNFFTLALQ